MATPSLVEDVVIEEELVDLWPDYPCLYDARSPEFKNRDKREKAVAEMDQKLDKTEDWIKLKLRAFRNAYTKLKKAPSSGSARKTAGKRATWILQKLQFLAPHVATRNSISNIDEALPSHNVSGSSIINEEETFDDDVESPLQMHDTPEPSEASTSSAISKKSKTKGLSLKRQHEDDKLIQCLTQSISSKLSKKSEGSKSNPTSAFANYVASQSSELDAKTRALAQHKINEILSQAQMGTLMQNDARHFVSQQYMPHQYQMGSWNQNQYQPMGLPQGYQHQKSDCATSISMQADGMAQPRTHLESLSQESFSNENLNLTTL